MAKKILLSPITWVLSALVFLGLTLYFVFPGYSFSGLLCFGLAALIVCYVLLNRLAKTRKAALWLRRILSITLAVLLLAASVTLIFIGSAAAGQADTPCAYIVVLGAGVNGTVPSLSLRERLDAAYAYLSAHPETVCVVSGGQGGGENITEAQCMFDWLTARGIEPERIWMEDAAVNTRQNLQFSLDLIESRTGSRPQAIGLVSSEYHLLRAGMFAREQGVTAVGIPAKTTYLSLRINYALREILAVWYYSIF